MKELMTNLKIICFDPDEGKLVKTSSTDPDKLVVRVVCERIVLCDDDGLCRAYALAVPQKAIASGALSTAMVFLCADDGSLLDCVTDTAIIEAVYQCVLEKCA